MNQRTLRRCVGPKGYLGRHTAASHLFERRIGGEEAWKSVPYLDENNGTLPPFILAFGSRGRVAKAIELLQLRDVVRLDEVARDLLGDEAYGRVSLAIGKFSIDGLDLPLLLMETQMGDAATQINLREVLALSSDVGYMVDEKFVSAEQINLIRGGTCGGITQTGMHPELQVGDIVVVDETIGHSGVIAQSLGVQAFLDPDAARIHRERIGELGYELKDHYPVLVHDQELVTLLESSVSTNCRVFIGPNFAKASLYMESDEEATLELRLGYGVLITEMEQAIIQFVADQISKAHRIRVRTGLIATVVGLVPGGSFAESEDEIARANLAKDEMIIAAATALHKVAYPR